MAEAANGLGVSFRRRVVRESSFDEPEAVAAMGDPHVVYLRYRLVPTNDETEFRAASLDRETDDFSIHVGPQGEGLTGPFAAVSARPADEADADALRVRLDIEAVFTFKVQHRSEHAAREAVRPFVEAWELDENLRAPGERPRFELEFAGSLIVDRTPAEGEQATYAVSGGGSFYVRPPTQVVVVEEFSEPPTQLVADAHAKNLWRRWERYLNGEDTLAAAAYACLTYVETEMGPGRQAAAARLGTSRAVLQKIGTLSSRVGDEATARKFDQTPRRAHTKGEIAFLEGAVTALMRRVAEVAAAGNASSLRPISLADFPAV
jgi:hypothetical protein